MLITICDLPIEKAQDIENNFGGKTIRSCDGVCDMQFENFKLTIYPTYILLRNPNALNNNYSRVITRVDFSTIHAQ